MSHSNRPLWKAIRDNHDDLLRGMDSNSVMLKSLSKDGLLRLDEVPELERIHDAERRNAELLQQVLDNDSKVSDGYEKFVGALRKSNQNRLADRIEESSPDTSRQLSYRPSYRDSSPGRSMNVNDYLEREARRVKVNYDDELRDRDDRKPSKRSRSESPARGRAAGKADNKDRGDKNERAGRSLDRSKKSQNDPKTSGKKGRNPGPGESKRKNNTKDQTKRSADGSSKQTEDTTKGKKTKKQRGDDDLPKKSDRDDIRSRPGESPLDQLERCRVVIEKLHKDCDDVARKHADVLDKLRLVDTIVQKTVPGESRGRRNSKKADNDDVSPRHKQRDEADRIMGNVRDRLTDLAEDLRVDDQQVAACDSILDKIRLEVAERNRILGDIDSGSLSRRSVKGASSPTPAVQASGRLGQLRTKLVNLAGELATYVRREKQQTSHKKTTGKSVTHRNFDQVDHDLTVLQRELRQSDKSTSVQAVQRLADVTKTERGDCLRMVEDIERLVQKRRLRIQENMVANGIATAKPTGPAQRSPVLQRKVRDSQTVESNMFRKLTSLGDEIKMFMEVEFEHGQKVRDEFHRRRQDLDHRAKGTSLEIQRLERRVHDAELDAQRYRRLFEQAQAVQQSRLLNKTTASKRGGDSTSRRAYSVGADTSKSAVRLPPLTDTEDAIPSRSSFVETPKRKSKPTDDDYDIEERQYVQKYSGTPLETGSPKSPGRQTAQYIQTVTSEEENQLLPNGRHDNGSDRGRDWSNDGVDRRRKRSATPPGKHHEPSTDYDLTGRAERNEHGQGHGPDHHYDSHISWKTEHRH